MIYQHPANFFAGVVLFLKDGPFSFILLFGEDWATLLSGQHLCLLVQVPFRSDPPEDNSNNHDDQCLVHQQWNRDLVGTLRLLCLDGDHLDLLLRGLPSHLAILSNLHHWPTDYNDSVASSPSGTEQLNLAAAD